VHTGNRWNAHTDSNVNMVIDGDHDRSHVLCLKDPLRKTFRRGGVDTFIISTEK
jgi:hypothetical protein